MTKRVKNWVCIGLLALPGALGCGGGDKVLAPDSQTDPSTREDGGASGPDGAPDAPTENDGSGGGGTASSPVCDMNGVWIGRQVTVSTALGVDQVASNWYYFEAQQEGDEVTITRHMDCGIEVQGVARVQIRRGTLTALLDHNVQTGRRGTLRPGAAGTCDFDMERFWSVRGANEAKYAPSPRNLATRSVAQLAEMNPLPNRNNPQGAEDWDGDGELGIAWVVSNFGTRHSVQRDWTRYFSDAEHPFPASETFAKDIVVRAEFSNEEHVLAPASGVITTISTPKLDAKHTLTLRFLGRDRSAPRAKALIQPDRVATCLAIQNALPAADKL